MLSALLNKSVKPFAKPTLLIGWHGLTLQFKTTVWVLNYPRSRKQISRYPDHNCRTLSGELFGIVHELNDKKYTYFVCGEFKINLKNKIQCVTDYLDMLHGLSYKVPIDKPTRITEHSKLSLITYTLMILNQHCFWHCNTWSLSFINFCQYLQLVKK